MRTSTSKISVPRSGLLVERRFSTTRANTRSTSPGRTGSFQWIGPRPGDPRLASPSMNRSTSTRIIIEHVCHPLAINPPYGHVFATSGSVWNGCGS